MLTELSSLNFAIAQPIFRNFQHSLAPQAILAGHSPGRVFVDHAKKPAHALIWDGAAHLYLAGDGQKSEFHQYMGEILAAEIGPAMLARGNNYYVLLGEPQIPPGILHGLLPGRCPIPQKRRFYTFFSNQSLPPQRDTPPSARIVNFDKALFASPAMASNPIFHKWLRDTWQETDLLHQYGFGTCVLIGNTLAAWCMAENVTPNSCEAGIETLPSFQRQGLAYLTARAFLIQCRQRRLKTIWVCRENNLASSALAEKLGFSSRSDFIAWFGSFDDHEEQRILLAHNKQ